MDVCLVSSRFYPQLVGSGTSAFVIASGLAKRGHTVTVLVDGGMRGEGKHQDLPFEVRYVDELEHFAMGQSSLRAPLQNLCEHLLKTQPDILHVCNFMPMFLVTLIRGLIHCPVVFTFFNTPDMGKRSIGYFSDSTLDSALASYIIKSKAYDVLVLGSKHYIEAAVALGADPKTLTLSYLPPDMSFVGKEPSSEPEKKALINKYFPDQQFNAPYILLPSRITRQKGILEAVEALHLVNQKASRLYKLLLTGMPNPFDPTYAREVNDRVDELGMRGYILVPNKTIDRCDLPTFFKSASLVVVPSWYEGLGLSAIEAQYFGTPLAVASTRGLDEIVENGKNGVSFAPRNSHAMAEAIVSVLEGSLDTALMVKEARRTVTKFSIEKHIDDIELCYKHLAGDRA